MYPPIQNLIGVLEPNTFNRQFYIFSTKGSFKQLALFKTSNKNIKIIRLGTSGANMNKIVRAINYIKFYVISLIYFLFHWPQTVLYYETLSSFTPYLYKRFFNRKSNVLIHYHEYTSPKEYQEGMMLTKLFHKYEKYLYPKVKWLSHTNKYRMELFKTDVTPIRVNNEKIFANYPPAYWFNKPLLSTIIPLKIIYVGSLSMDTMYTQKFSEWVQSQNGQVVWHIFSYNITPQTIAYFKELNSPYIVLKVGVNYIQLPEILKMYSVGVILYNGHSENYIYNAPNKLFEYLSCGLDVWYPDVMQGCYEYDNTTTSPSVIRINFNTLSAYKFSSIKINKPVSEKILFCAENESAEMVACLVN